MKTLYLDIETSPNVCYTWGLYNENIGINQVIEPTRVICVAFKLDDQPMDFTAEWQPGGHKRMIRRVRGMLEAADAVVHYNGSRFDEPHLNREFLQAGLSPPSQYRTIDLCTTVKKRFRFAAARLQQVVTELDLGEKIKTDFDLWKDVLAGDPKAQKLMERYNKHDVQLLVDLYEQIRPWVVSHPNVALYSDDPTRPQCTRCGGDVRKNGVYRTNSGVYQGYRCVVCDSQSRDMSRLITTPLRTVS